MNTDSSLAQIAQDTGGRLIAISRDQADQMQKWSDGGVLPDNMNPTECLGFINQTNAGDAIDMVLDLQVPAGASEAQLRIWAITSEENERHIVLFNNIQLNFQVSLGLAQVLAMKGAAFSREDITAVLHDSQTRLSRLVISAQSGVDQATGQKYGTRFDLSPIAGNNEIMHDAESNREVPSAEVQQALDSVLSVFETVPTQAA